MSDHLATAHVSDDFLEPDSNEEQIVDKADDRPVTSQIADWTISALRDKLDRGQLDLQPLFKGNMFGISDLSFPAG